MARRLDAVFLDRDGTINVKAPDGDYITDPEQLELLPGTAEAIRILNRAGVPAVVITNQRGVALGRMDESDLAAVHARLYRLLGDHDARLDGIFYCPHDEGTCACRKPGTLLLHRARAFLRLTTLRHTVMIGDSLTDVEAGQRAGARRCSSLGAVRRPRGPRWPRLWWTPCERSLAVAGPARRAEPGRRSTATPRSTARRRRKAPVGRAGNCPPCSGASSSSAPRA